ncbi:MAG: hypothetical protein LBP73_10750 [Clostridiales Family XIII bacterium]|jgi:hypothetical protein|nr:hypothetical protein [Clostridiales Family XIII bacterium]
MANFGALGGISSLHGYSSQLRSLYNIERDNNPLFKALTNATKKNGASSIFGNGALDTVAGGGFASWNKNVLKRAGVDPASLNYLKTIKSGAKELKAAIAAAPRAATAGGGKTAGATDATAGGDKTAGATDAAGGKTAGADAGKTADAAASAGDEKAMSAVKNIVNGANKLLSAAYENIGKGSERLFDDVVGAVKTYAPELDRIGVSMGSDGLLKVDGEKIKSAASNGTLNKFLSKSSSSSYGFTSKLARVAQTVESNPSHYTNAGSKAVNNTGYYDSQSYNRYSNVGLLLNSLI